MSNLSLNEIMGLIDGATSMSPSSSQPSAKLSLNDITSLIPDVPSVQAPTPSAPTAYDSLSALRTSSTGANSVVRGALQFGSNISAALGDMDTAANLDMTIRQYYAPEAPNFQNDTGTFAYESIASNAPQMGLTLGLAAIPVVGIPLAIASVALPLFGESRKEIARVTGKDDPYAALVPASINTALDLAVPMRIARKLGMGSFLKNKFDDVNKDLLPYLTKETMTTAGMEGVTELGQWASNLATTRFLTDKNILDRLTPQEQQEALNNFFGGAFGGGGFGLGAAGYSAYQNGQSKVAVERELKDLDDLLNGIRVDPSAPTTPTAAQGTDPTQTPSTQSELAIPQPTAVSSQATPTETEINGIKYSLINTIKELPKPVYDMTLSALETRRQELTSLISALDSDLNLSALSVPSSTENEQISGQSNTGSTGFSTIYTALPWLESTLYIRDANGNIQEKGKKSAAKDDMLATLGLSESAFTTQSIAVAAKTPDNFDTLYQTGELMQNVLAQLGLDKALDGRPLKIIVNDLSTQIPAFRKGTVDGKTYIDKTYREGSMSFIDDYIVLEMDPSTSDLKTQYTTAFHEIGHYIAMRLTTDAQGKAMPETDALRSAYAKYLRNKSFEQGVPGHQGLLQKGVQVKYATSFNEWLAEGFRQAMHNRVADGSIDLRKEAPSLFDKFNTGIRRLYRMSRKYIGASSAGIETFQQFVDRALAKRELLEVEAKIAGMTANQSTELAKDAPQDALPEEKPKAKPKAKKTKRPVQTEGLVPDSMVKAVEEVIKQQPGLQDFTLTSQTWKQADEFVKSFEVKFRNILAQLPPEYLAAVARFREGSLEPLAAENPVVETLNKIRLTSQAANTNQLMEVNMGILGDSVLGKFFRSVMTPLQVAEQSANRGFNLGKTYMAIVQQLQLMKTTVVEIADTTLKSWRQGGTESTGRVSKALYVISTKSDELGRRLMPSELDQVFDGLNMTPEERAAWAEVDSSFKNVLDKMWASTLLDIARTYNQNPRNRQAAKDFRDAYLAAKTQTEKNLLIEQYTGQPLVDADLNLNPMAQAIDSAMEAQAKMQNKNYFPRSRMGEYVVRIKANAKGDEWEGHVAKSAGETLGFYAFDTESEQRAFMDAIADDVDGMKVLAHKLDSEVFSVMGLPAGIIDQIVRDMDANPTTKLSALQRELLNDIALQRSPGKRFLRHMTRRRGIAGYSEDALRVYANYMSMASNHLARSEYSPELASVIADMNSQIQNPGDDFALVNDWNVLKDYFVKHFDYLMKPDNDWATLRSVGFLWYLGFNVKSAVVNLMQTPMVTLPVLSKDIGTAKAAGRIATSMKDIVQHLRAKSNLSPDELSMIDYMLKANLIDESLVSELAGLGEADVLKRLVPGMNAQSVLTKVSWYGGAMFRMGEKFNRYSTALASYRIGRNDLKLSHEAALQYSVDAIQASQFEYAKFNRPEFMRGKKSVIFLFWQYMQHASYLFFGGKGSRVAKRMWLMTFAMAGLEGLPFAQFLMKLIDFGGTAVRDVFGVADPKVETNKMIRELISNIYDRPDDIMKGMSYQWGLGPFHLLRPLGVPVPNVTTEGSLGFGNPVPWFDGLMDPTINDMDKALGQTAATMLGPIGGMVLGVVEALGYSKEEDNWKRWEKTLPVFMKNAAQGTRWMMQGEETTSNGMQVVQFETPEQRAEVALKTLGFTPTRLDQTRRQMRAAQESLLYYQARKQMLMDDFWYAQRTKDREFMADARQAIRDYNTEVREAKLGQFMIKPSSLTTSVSERTKARALSERGIAPDKRQEALRRQAERLIPVTAKGEER